MTPLTIGLLALGGVGLLALATSFTAVGIYNQLVKLKNRYVNGFSQIEVQLKRRYDLIPNLVETTKAYLKHERQTLEAVISARNQAAQGLAKAAQDPTNSAAMQAWVGAESSLAGAMGRLAVVMEAYPELKANETVAHLSEELVSTENKIAFARQAYNDWVTNYNTYRETFPQIALASLLGHGQNASLLNFDDQPQIQAAPAMALVS